MEFESESGSDYDEDEESDEERNRAGDRKLVLSRWFDIGSDVRNFSLVVSME